MARVELKQVEKIYPNGFKAIHGIDLDIADGEFIVLVGPSGCGKSTLLRMVAGLETVTAGEIHIADKLVNELEPSERDIAMVFQNYALYPHMTNYQNMAYGLKNKGMAKDEIAQRVAEAARILELDGLLDRKPRQLSGGQRQRVAMGRAIVRDPAAFLFDEPLSNLDAKLRVQMRVEIRKLQRQLGTTSLYVTHDQVEAMTMADRLVVMNAGVAEQIGSPMEVYDRPATTFVADFIGSPSMNLLAGRLAGNGDMVEIGGRALAIQPVANAPAGDVTIGLRPEQITAAPATDGRLSMTVELVEALGADSLVHGKVEGLDRLLTIRVAGHSPAAVGDVLGLDATGSPAHLFDRETGRRLD
jgi:sn-glycerol 3-phosphate transport system ATP-binding protein